MIQVGLRAALLRPATVEAMARGRPVISSRAGSLDAATGVAVITGQRPAIATTETFGVQRPVGKRRSELDFPCPSEPFDRQ